METAEPRDHLLILFDGVCGFCNAGVTWLLDRDPREVLRFAPLQGETAASLRRRHDEIPADIDTLVVVDTREGQEKVFLRSAAVVRILGVLESPWRHFRLLRLVPAPLLDLGYRAFARLRYRIFGKRDTCRVPSPEERTRMLP